MVKVASASQRLINRINREFTKKKFIGDILISDEEFEILINNLRFKFNFIRTNKRSSCVDPVLAVAMVQIGIRFYDGNYWGHLKELLGYSGFNVSHQAYLGNAFVETMRKHDKLCLGASERINSVLMHGFVSDNYSERFFDFLFAFYNIDLERDLSRLDRETMNSLIEVMGRSDNTGRTYHLVEQTADAVRKCPRSAKMRIRSYLRLIDKAFWNEDLPEVSTSRIVMRLIEWAEHSKEFENVREKYTAGATGRSRNFSSPHISCNFQNNEFSLVFPKQIIKFAAGKPEELYWDVTTAETNRAVAVDVVAEGVTGYCTDEISVSFSDSDLFSDVVLLLKAGENALRRFKIKSEKIRFFDEHGKPLNIDGLKAGTAFSYSTLDFIPTGRSILYSEKAGGLLRTAYEIENGDLILLPDGKPISVGSDIKEGLQSRGDISGLSANGQEERMPVYKNIPQIVFRTRAERLSGTALFLDGRINHLEEINSKENCLTGFDLNDRSGEQGYLLDVSQFVQFEDGLHEIRIDIPNDHTNRTWKFLLIGGFSYKFEGAPYIFQSRGSLMFPLKYLFQPIDGGRIEKEEDGNVYNFEITPGKPEIRLSYLGTEVVFEVPALSYKFAGENWQIAPHLDIWHSDFEPRLYLDYDKDRVRFFMEDTDDTVAEHSQVFIRNKRLGLFECDLNRFKSWFGRDQIKKSIFLELPDRKEPVRFFKIVTQSYFVSGLLTVDLNKDQIEGRFEIVGKAEYFVDLFIKEDVIIEKIPLLDGKFTAETPLRTGLYKAVVYEAETDESGFGENVFFKIGEAELDLINPMDLNGKSIEVSALIPAENPETYFPLKYRYHIVELSNRSTGSRHDYFGKMIVWGTFGDKLFATFQVNVSFYDLNDLRNSYITFLDENEPMEFLYDESLKKIVKQEDGQLKKREAYRRYRFAGPEEFIYRVNFYNPSENEIIMTMDDGEYNNLVVKKKEFSVFKKNETPIANDRKKTENNPEEQLNLRRENVLRTDKVKTVKKVPVVNDSQKQQPRLKAELINTELPLGICKILNRDGVRTVEELAAFFRVHDLEEYKESRGLDAAKYNNLVAFIRKYFI